MKEVTETDIPTIIECRDEKGKLRDIWFDERLPYIKNTIMYYVEIGHTDFRVVKNENHYDLDWLWDY
jgi:hypothetical protein